MNESEAYAILHIAPGSSQDEIKEAYAMLSKTYHPEEHPDEFQQIHEAYRLLCRRARGERSRRPEPAGYENHSDDAEEKTQKNAGYDETESYDEAETFANGVQDEEGTSADEQSAYAVYEETWNQTEAFSANDWQDAETEDPEQEAEQEDASTQQYDFEEVIEESDQEDTQRLIYLIQKALIEMEMLLKPQYCNKLKLFQQFFAKPEYQTAWKQPVFMEQFADMLEDTKLKPAIYDCIIEAYRFRGLNPGEMYEEAAKLYYVLDKKRGMHPKKGGAWKATVVAGVVAGIRAGTRSTTEGTTAGDFFSLLAIAVIIIALLVFGYRQLYKNHSSLFAQAMMALLLTISQFIVLGGDFYAPLMGSGNGTVLSLLLFLAGGVWLIGVGIAAIIQKIRHRS